MIAIDQEQTDPASRPAPGRRTDRPEASAEKSVRRAAATPEFTGQGPGNSFPKGNPRRPEMRCVTVARGFPCGNPR
ncbi:hypothetical protein AB0D74_35360, partial [Streptomyces sp. NPDC048278]|uniref:hypothetical protein n=1 Tax=Streptomyces sp. NPDC048278 TaxID=3155809 RepID=UPI003416D25B